MTEFKELPKVIGMKQTLKQLETGCVIKVVLAEDTDEPLKEKIIKACGTADVPVITCRSKHALGKESGIERDAAVVALLK
ncbi:MAG: ribosomal L7Ae/L30e/S12e/Gadd45 family protein [Eubacterium aggregans]|uniref:Large subunit ribosomal protein L7A n=1 Tax=Eubacterium aggregans TaxID=81409 RepID=A0A1H4AKY5_9FIRM|nr:ribosomal L7Ae/L30e/S12e/Gadd45 family protein [Eubacterium aggregans]MDD4691573.1 ribosomal L7Ae/L30e/S12e/Gadd45 family protein [Eubacterium aggregans]MEA5073354.1 ribosomal L7Ae/L30e/S12e/Gadd45 family protein [Eubacterium aggregans]SEA36629.1 large subunit ribosomal protein L7A [Eubacterium aggregans]